MQVPSDDGIETVHKDVFATRRRLITSDRSRSNPRPTSTTSTPPTDHNLPQTPTRTPRPNPRHCEWQTAVRPSRS